MKLGIIGAMEQEVETLVSLLENKRTVEYAGSLFCEGVLDGVDAVVVRCGIGKVNAALCVQILCDRFGVTHLVNTGIAGSLCSELDIGDLVISRDAMYHDAQACVFGYPAGQVPGMPLTYEADTQMVRLAVEAGESVNPGHCTVGRVASGDQFVSEKALKEQIIAITQALCTEMEGAAIAHAAYRNGIPFVIIRAISDKADESAEMDYPSFEAVAARRCAAVTRAFATLLKKKNAQ